MGKMGFGYGSEFHLLRWMGRHRALFDEKILAAIGRGNASVEWLDFKFHAGAGSAGKSVEYDAEWKGLDFLSDNKCLQEAWKEFWPTRSGVHNWDAVGWASGGEKEELLLVEAKAHAAELKSDTKAKATRSVAKIRKAFEEVKTALGVTGAGDWMREYYQFANRLAMLHFLDRHGIAARLIFVYFVGDRPGPTRNCPRDQEGWSRALAEQEKHVGLPEGHRLANRIHKVFLSVDGR